MAWDSVGVTDPFAPGLGPGVTVLKDCEEVPEVVPVQAVVSSTRTITPIAVPLRLTPTRSMATNSTLLR
jgi:hypothetical protein